MFDMIAVLSDNWILLKIFRMYFVHIDFLHHWNILTRKTFRLCIHKILQTKWNHCKTRRIKHYTILLYRLYIWLNINLNFNHAIIFEGRKLRKNWIELPVHLYACYNSLWHTNFQPTTSSNVWIPQDLHSL